ncbi:MAG: patatin-like phospholipase family protein [Endomicrobium sp.]|uniref:patatin-like phospholipase family protein n=1 Tax=Candidatus Endomicrobiellum pyrsonymphae TaxID=1408203 RepID=UPI00358AC21E|nr:patatin-like phospholipase family protein [Endomicrobium sp.]
MIPIKKYIKVFSLFISTILAVSTVCAAVSDFNEEDFLIDVLWRKVELAKLGERPKVALVLGGGGARGISHIGVLRVISEEHIPIDIVIGTSIGSIAGAFFCAGMPFDSLDDLAKTIGIKDISNYSYPSLISMFLNGNLLSNENLENLINKTIGDTRFDQLKIQLICVATDLNTGEKILLREGSVAFAVRASSTIPGIFKPVEYMQRYLVDGGLAENIPVSVAKIFGADVIIAVSVSADITKNNTANVFFTLMQAMYIQGMVLDQYNLNMADVVIYPDVGSLSVLDFKGSHKTIDKGFVASKRAVKNIKKVIINKMMEKYLLE